jgi:hypothetical protein
MNNNLSKDSKDLLPSETEIRQIIAQVLSTNPAQAPVVLMQIEVARLAMKVLDRFREVMAESIKQLEDKL